MFDELDSLTWSYNNVTDLRWRISLLDHCKRAAQRLIWRSTVLIF